MDFSSTTDDAIGSIVELPPRVLRGAYLSSARP